ncbi:MAG: radical SAM protein, partial [Methanobrevibacter boviskoreani]|nr:radical SAM protein [Methanobrevibacter boviskoreani]
MIYEENIVQKKIQNIDIRFGLVYPNVYKIAMSSLGYQIIYNLLNDRDDCFCERIIFPNTRSIETNSPSSDFNILSFTIQFEEDYFNLVKILKESNIPLRREDRTDKDPLIIAGGPTVTANPMPIADFVDIFIIGEGENVLSEFLDLYREIPNPHENLDKFLDIESLYIPKFNNKTEISL